MSEPLIIKYRPTAFSEVVGNRRVVQALQDELKSPSRYRAYLFTGIVGVGKTSCAHILAETIDASIVDYDAGCRSGKTVALDIVHLAGFTSMLGRPNRLFLIDEAQALRNL